jgi:Rieske Fe-S protein
MLATGGVVAAGIIGAGGIGITHFLQSGSLQQSTTNHPTTPAQTMPKQGNNAVANQQGTNGNQDNMAKQATTTKQAPAKQAQQPAHTGTVVGKSNQAPNTSQAFKNPADNNASLLVRLPDGAFVAYEQACTHQGVPVNYHPDTHTFICPLHGSIFDPAQNGKVLQGPAAAPLPAVKVSVNGDGTITAV